jgi:single-strand DNA-binding protein
MYNKIIVIGNAGRDAELNYTSQGRAMAKFSLAVTRNFRSGAEWKSETEWFDVVQWGDAAERVADNVCKGNRIMVEGRVSLHEWTGRDGNQRASMQISANRVKVFERKEAPADDSTAPIAEQPKISEEEIEELPW